MSSVSRVLDVYLLYSVSCLISTYVDRGINLMKSNVQCLLESILLSQVCFTFIVTLELLCCCSVARGFGQQDLFLLFSQYS